MNNITVAGNMVLFNGVQYVLDYIVFWAGRLKRENYTLPSYKDLLAILRPQNYFAAVGDLYLLAPKLDASRERFQGEHTPEDFWDLI